MLSHPALNPNAVAVVTGAGGNFCAGMGLKAFAAGEIVAIPGRGIGFTERPPVKPLIAAVDGLQLISIVRGFDVRVPICMMSSVPIKASALARGATAFFAKSELWARLEGLVGNLRADAAPLAA